jgi:hypothetical protein
MKIGAVIGLSAFIILMLIQIGSFYKQQHALEADLVQVMEQAKKADADYKSLQADYEYYQNPANLEKELRSRFNYHSPDEKLIVIVPKPSSTLDTATTNASY